MGPRGLGYDFGMEIFGLSGSELIIILVVAVLVVGPKGVAQAMSAFRKTVAKAKEFSARLREETAVDLSGTAIPKMDLSGFDLRGLDPRVMIREAVAEEMDAWMKQAQALNPAAPAASPAQPGQPGQPPVQAQPVPSAPWQQAPGPAIQQVTPAYPPQNPMPPAPPAQPAPPTQAGAPPSGTQAPVPKAPWSTLAQESPASS